LPLLDAITKRIVAEGGEGVKLAADHVFMISGLAKGGELHDEHGDRTHQKDVHHAAFVKKNR
jgi:hypothetical protein